MKSFTAIGEEIGISRESVRQTYIGAMSKLRDSMTKEDVRELFDDKQEPYDEMLQQLLYEGSGEDDNLYGFWNPNEE